MVKRIGILTGGGDCPGLNAVIRAIVKSSIYTYGIEVVGISDGFKGAVEKMFQPLDLNSISGILPRGGTILGTSNRDNPFSYAVKVGDKTVYEDRSAQMLENFRTAGIELLVAIGGDGSLNIAKEIFDLGFPVIGVPKTIDNDLFATDATFGYQTAVETACDALDKLHTTAESHHRIMILEVMGRYAGWIALAAGIAGGADVVLIPEIPYDLFKITKTLEKRVQQGKKYSVIIVAEGAKPFGGQMVVEKRIEGRTDPIKLGGIGNRVGEKLEQMTGMETRVTVLGHLQRGGSPNSYDRILATRYGVAAVEAVTNGENGVMVALQGSQICTVPLAEAVSQLKFVPLNHELLLAARSIGIGLGD
ncbi:MAG: ATP-dependent 6-phosphofructokinase [Peptococcaceae bacterium]|nr:ATP-dependent 6-phosphofructokinase [Peptococcaceae bacterium]